MLWRRLWWWCVRGTVVDVGISGGGGGSVLSVLYWWFWVRAAVAVGAGGVGVGCGGIGVVDGGGLPAVTVVAVLLVLLRSALFYCRCRFQNYRSSALNRPSPPYLSRERVLPVYTWMRQLTRSKDPPGNQPTFGENRF